MPIVRGGNSSYLLHEFLEPCNAPCYFKEFVARAEGHGLAYLCEAEPSTMFAQNYGEKVRDPLMRECGDSQVMMEQYLDFLVNRTFRQSLLVKEARAPQIRYRLDRTRLRALEYAGRFKPVDGDALTMDAREQPCEAIRNLSVTLRLPVHKAVAQVLEERYPATIGVAALLDAVASRTGAPPSSLDAAMMSMLEELLILGAVRVRRRAVAVAPQVGPQPQALAAIRNAPGLALSAGPTATSCNQWHESVNLSLIERCLLPLLDGTRSHQALAEHLEAEARADRLRFTKDDQPLQGDALPDFAREQVALALNELQRKALLVA